MIGDAVALARKDLLLELRGREVVLAMLEFVIATLVLIHFAIAGDAGRRQTAAAGMLWVAILFTAMLSLNRCFAAEREDGALDALLLAPIDRAAIWLGKVLAQITFLLVMEARRAAAVLAVLLRQKGRAPAAGDGGRPALANIGLAALGVAAGRPRRRPRAPATCSCPCSSCRLRSRSSSSAVTATLRARFPGNERFWHAQTARISGFL